jgi:hypothetical protein
MYNESVLIEIEKNINNDNDSWTDSDYFFSKHFEFVNPDIYNFFMEDITAKKIYDLLIDYNDKKIIEKNNRKDLILNISSSNLVIEEDKKESYLNILNDIITNKKPMHDHNIQSLLIDLNLFQQEKKSKYITILSRNNNIYKIIKYKEKNAHQESQKIEKIHENADKFIKARYIKYLKDLHRSIKNNKSLKKTPTLNDLLN